MKKSIKIIAIIALVVLVGIQFVPTERNQSDIVPVIDFMLVNNVPKTIQKKLQVSCYDCHSNNTQYPWYNKVQPVTWFLEGHIKEGKAELNFNEWDSLSNRRKKSKLRSIIKQIESGEMPLDSYTLIHKDATFSKEETNEIINFITQLKDSL
ncbi:heme-binding protein [Dokdonia sp. Hel_I_63]|uniref:heme-binding domain-containing protein n=1 Tax=Dokdonia sp. Hel_I_63 TaxID=1249996 RepID=UPI001198CF97|nr:heme-binding domain-containing protein [Dokdonia sp. Hel_I_63]TVZ21643.1 heme-binding protein [Dokdonia sp. Hel_I_63]